MLSFQGARGVHAYIPSTQLAQTVVKTLIKRLFLALRSFLACASLIPARQSTLLWATETP